ncbi:Htur_1727 family rSAM-partnered candidate RiPP [Halorientalis salina]|uniref:Htur_1727 family rSAM-partnered candidate RiPP n=1 Tax=Halorientalis salina TaxID=2932266 RepID=UPI0010ACE609|nr:Htur_1727 family rSAM-partnered candidate RiPP [Halorientalis salina]
MAERASSTGPKTVRATTGREWELFVSDDEGPPRHAGSVSAPTADVAREQARNLLGWSVDDVWLCPADEVERFSPSEDSR